MRQTSTGIYLSYLAIIDILFLYIRIIPELFHFINGYRIVFRGHFQCKSMYFMTYYVDHLSSWVRLFFTIERVIAVT